MAEFRIGDRLIHPLYGAGTVVSIAKQGDNGMAKDHYVIELGPGQARLMTPVEKAEQLGLRRPILKKNRRELMKVFAGRPRELEADYRKRQRSIADRLREGDFVEVGRVIRDLAWRKGEGRANVGDRRLLNRAKELLAEELAECDGIVVAQAMERIESALERQTSGRRN